MGADLARWPITLGGRARPSFPLWREQGLHLLDAPWSVVLPDAGLPQGAVVEVAAHASLGQGTSFALAACARVQAEAERRGGDVRWCAWVDTDRSLYAPAALADGVVLDRLLVVRPLPVDMPKAVVRLASSRLFGLVVVDVCALPGTGRNSESLTRWVNLVRRISLGISGSDTTVLLLTDSDAARPLPLPVALRLELEPRWSSGISARVAKERHGRTSGPRTIAWSHPWHDLLERRQPERTHLEHGRLERERLEHDRPDRLRPRGVVSTRPSMIG